MSDPTLRTHVRSMNDQVSIVDIEGEATTASDDALMAAFAEASRDNPRCVILNLSRVERIGSSFIDAMVIVLTQAKRRKQRLLAYGLPHQYLPVLALTRLDEQLAVFASENEALAAATSA